MKDTDVFTSNDNWTSEERHYIERKISHGSTQDEAIQDIIAFRLYESRKAEAAKHGKLLCGCLLPRESDEFFWINPKCFHMTLHNFKEIGKLLDKICERLKNKDKNDN